VSQGRKARDLNIALSPQRDGHCVPGGLVDQIFLGIVRSLRWLEGASKEHPNSNEGGASAECKGMQP
jgi:hypothetical protein